MPLAMSNQNQNPIRVADLSDSIYVPRVQPPSTIKAYVPAAKKRNSSVLNEQNSQYAWNKQPEQDAPIDAQTVATTAKSPSQISLSAHITSALPIERLNVGSEQYACDENAPATERYSHSVPKPFPNSSDIEDEYRTLSEMRAQFASEAEQNIQLLRPTIVDEVYPEQLYPINVNGSAVLEEDSVADALERFVVEEVNFEPPETTRVWGLDYHAVDMERTLDYLEQVISTRRPSFAVTANVNYAMLCAQNPRLAAFTQNAALTLCDGMPILWRSKLNTVKLPERVAGSDLIYRLTERCAKRRLRVYFYGASEGIAEKTAANLKSLYPKLVVAGVQCPAFRACSSEEIRGQIARIKQTNPDVLFVALGQPKGEYWIEDHLEELQIPLTIQLGASFDFVAGNATRAPKPLQKFGLEWFYRMVKDPARLAPRYFRNFVFLVKAIRQDLIDKLS